MDRPELFPYEEFTLWVQDAITVGNIVNKLRTAEQEAATITLQEHALILAVRGEIHTQSFATIEALVLLPVDSAYPLLPEDEMQIVWNVLTEYLTAGAHYLPLRELLEGFLRANPAVGQLLANMAGCFGPALAPREAWRRDGPP